MTPIVIAFPYTIDSIHHLTYTFSPSRLYSICLPIRKPLLATFEVCLYAPKRHYKRRILYQKARGGRVGRFHELERTELYQRGRPTQLPPKHCFQIDIDAQIEKANEQIPNIKRLRRIRRKISTCWVLSQVEILTTFSPCKDRLRARSWATR